MQATSPIPEVMRTTVIGKGCNLQGLLAETANAGKVTLSHLHREL